MKKLAAQKMIEKMDEIDPDAIKAFSISIMLKDDMSDEDMSDDDSDEEHDADTYEKHMKMKKMDCKEEMEDA